MDYLAALRESFVKGIPDRLHSIKERWRARDPQGVAYEAHKLRGAAGGFGFQEVSQAAARLEEALKSVNSPPSPSDIHDLIEHIQEAARLAQVRSQKE